MAPAVRTAIAEEFGKKPGKRLVKNEIVTALKLLGLNIYMIDTNFTADLCIMEEGTELIERLNRAFGVKMFGGEHLETALPQFTSCCPG